MKNPSPLLLNTRYHNEQSLDTIVILPPPPMKIFSTNINKKYIPAQKKINSTISPWSLSLKWPIWGSAKMDDAKKKSLTKKIFQKK